LFYPRRIVSKRRERRIKKRKPSKFGRLLLIITIAVSITLLVLFIISFNYYVNLSQALPDIRKIEYDPPQSSEIFDRDGNLIRTVFFVENRIYVPLSQIPKNFIDALIASEDARFFEHKGVDLKAMFRALYVNWKEGKVVEGGSTLTQQLARELFLSKRVTIERKLKEIILALRLEKVYSKEEILEYYINQVYFGSGAYGVEAAARKYFGKHAKDLTLPESAMLVGVLPAPSEYSPRVNWEAAKGRQKLVLMKMVREGYITEEEMEEAVSTPIKLKEYREEPESDINGWFIDYIKETVRRMYGEELLYKGGLKIYTTLDPEIQKIAIDSLNKIIEDNVKQGIFSDENKDELGVRQPQGAVVVISPKTGEILAMVGGRDYKESQFNRCLALRKPGSSFKIFDYTPAIENGVVTPASILVSESINIGGWKPTEWIYGYFGPLTVRQALVRSSNICAVKTGMRVGLDRVVYYARKMGIRSPLKPYPSMTIGGFEVTPLDMAVSYSTLSNMGERVDATGILKIVGKDRRILYEHKVRPIRVVSPEASYIMTDIFKDVVHNYFPDLNKYPIAGKSGTAGDYTSGWFIGYTQDFTVSTYIGSDKELIGLEGVKNWGARFAGRVWKSVFEELLKIKKPTDWERPEGIVVRAFCTKTGLIATSYCKGKRYDFSIKGISIPNCSYHKPYKVKVCKGTNLIATDDCPPDMVEEKIFTDPDDMPKEYCDCSGGYEYLKLIAPDTVYTNEIVVFEIVSPLFKSGDTIEIDINGEKTYLKTYPLKLMWSPSRPGNYYVSVIHWSSIGEVISKTGKNIKVIPEIRKTEMIVLPIKPKVGDIVRVYIKNPPSYSYTAEVFINGKREGVLAQTPFEFRFKVTSKGSYRIVFKIYDLYGNKLVELEKTIQVP